MTNLIGFQNVLVATDFSPDAEAALKEAIWIARQAGTQITLIHVLSDLRKALLSASSDAQLDSIYGDGEKIQQEIREESLTRMHFLIEKLNANDLRVKCHVLLGDPSISIIHEVQRGKFDAVFVGTRNQSAWERFVMGSTAKRLIRKCPVPVWTVNTASSEVPRKILAATDFSEVSRRAALLGRRIARQSDAEFHLVHIIDAQELPASFIEKIAPGTTLHDELKSIAQRKMAEFITLFDGNPEPIHSHVSWGIAAQDIPKLAEQLKIDLLVLGSVGRSGIKGVLLGNTAEKLLNSCNCSILAVKPEGFVSPIEPAFWPLHGEVAKTNEAPGNACSVS